MNAPSSRSSSLHTDAAGAAPPDAFGPFRVLHQIGAGTLGPVFRAYDATRERLVAVKLFKLDLPPERGHQLVAEFERLIAAELDASRRSPRRSRPASAASPRISPRTTSPPIRSTSSSASTARRRSATRCGSPRSWRARSTSPRRSHVTHGALHPRDVLLSSDDTRLTGLGVARALERIGVVAPVRRPYTAPERIAGGEWDRRADVFSLAALMHELMWGRRVSGVGVQAAESLTEIAGGDLDALRDVFARALAEDPGRSVRQRARVRRRRCRPRVPDVAVDARAGVHAEAPARPASTNRACRSTNRSPTSEPTRCRACCRRPTCREPTSRAVAAPAAEPDARRAAGGLPSPSLPIAQDVRTRGSRSPRRLADRPSPEMRIIRLCRNQHEPASYEPPSGDAGRADHRPRSRRDVGARA